MIPKINAHLRQRHIRITRQNNTHHILTELSSIPRRLHNSFPASTKTSQTSCHLPMQQTPIYAVDPTGEQK